MPVNYDAWLVAPFERREREAEAFRQFCEEHDLETDDPRSEEMFEDYCQDISEAMAEAQAERLEWEREHIDYDFFNEYLVDDSDPF